jgi:catechol 2,3-dioxygenase-like lactoylglutathione lyase family enzyme
MWVETLARPGNHRCRELLTGSAHQGGPRGRRRAGTAQRSWHPPHLVVVDDIEASLAGLRAHGGELVNYENSYRLCYVRGPAGIVVELAEKIG